MRIPVLLIGVALILALGALRLADPGPVRDLRLAYFDLLQRVWPRPYKDVPVRVVDIDEASLERLGQWPWPRDLLAELTDRLAEAGAAAIAFDVLFAEPDRLSPSRLAAEPALVPLLRRALSPDLLAALDHDTRFGAAIARAPVVLGTARVGGAVGTPPVPKAETVMFGTGLEAFLPPLDATTSLVPVLESAASGIGSISVGPEGDTTVVRTVPLVWRTANGPIPSLALEALRVALGEDTLILWGDESASGVVTAVGVGPFDIPTMPDGQLWIRYRHDDPALYVPAHRVLDGSAGAELDGAVVLVGASAAGLLDLRTTALGETVPGVSIHAQIVEQVLTGDFLRRSDFANGLELALLLFSGLVVVAVMSISGPILSVLSGGAAAAAIGWASWSAFTTRGLLLDATFPLIGGFLAFSLLTVYRLFVTDRDARLIRRSFSRYVAPDVLKQIESGGHRIELGGTDRPVTVMFSDIRNFTQLSEGLTAQDLVRLLNGLFSTLSEEIIGEHGTIDKFMGDSIMAFWNAPVEAQDHVARACRAALRMRRALDGFNAANPARPVQTGLGLATGMACVGNLGSRDQFNYTVIGDTVNIAARVESICRHIDHDIAATDAVRAAAPEFAWLDGGAVALKGVSHRIGIHVLLGDATVAARPRFAELAAEHRALCDALRAGASPAAPLAACRRLADPDFPTLRGFYDRIADRPDDFAPAGSRDQDRLRLA